MHALDPPVIISEGEQVFPAKFMTPMRKTSYWYHYPDEAKPVMLKLKQVLIPYIEFIQDKNTTNKLSSRFNGYAGMNPHFYLNTIIKSYWIKLREDIILTMMNMWKMKITTM